MFDEDKPIKIERHATYFEKIMAFTYPGKLYILYEAEEGFSSIHVRHIMVDGTCLYTAMVYHACKLSLNSSAILYNDNCIVKYARGKASMNDLVSYIHTIKNKGQKEGFLSLCEIYVPDARPVMGTVRIVPHKYNGYTAYYDEMRIRVFRTVLQEYRGWMVVAWHDNTIILDSATFLDPDHPLVVSHESAREYILSHSDGFFGDRITH